MSSHSDPHSRNGGDSRPRSASSASGPPHTSARGRSLARHYADLWNLLESAGQKVGDDDVAVAAAELADGGWAVEKTPGGWRAVPHAGDDEADAGGMVRLSTDHAPVGGVTLQGKFFRGGQFIPSAVIASLSKTDQKKLADAKQAAKAKRVEAHAHKLPGLADKLKQYADVALSEKEQKSARLALAQLHRHHGDATLHRVSELAEQLEDALAKVPADEEGLRGQFQRRLAALHAMMGEAEKLGLKVPGNLEAAAQQINDFYGQALKGTLNNGEAYSFLINLPPDDAAALAKRFGLPGKNPVNELHEDLVNAKANAPKKGKAKKPSTKLGKKLDQEWQTAHDPQHFLSNLNPAETAALEAHWKANNGPESVDALQKTIAENQAKVEALKGQAEPAPAPAAAAALWAKAVQNVGKGQYAASALTDLAAALGITDGSKALETLHAAGLAKDAKSIGDVVAHLKESAKNPPAPAKPDAAALWMKAADAVATGKSPEAAVLDLHNGLKATSPQETIAALNAAGLAKGSKSLADVIAHLKSAATSPGEPMVTPSLTPAPTKPPKSAEQMASEFAGLKHSGQTAEAAAYLQSLSPDEKAALDQHWQTKWGITAAEVAESLGNSGPAGKAPPAPVPAPEPEPEPAPAAKPQPGTVPVGEEHVAAGKMPKAEDLAGLQHVGDLGGSTGAKLVQDAAGKKYVLKKGSSPEHVRSEATADALYYAAGVDVPRTALYETDAGPVKLSGYREGKTLAEYLKTASAGEKESALGKLRSGMAADALLGNWDVVGLNNDNVLVTKSGSVVRADNGGALAFRAQGGAKGKAWGDDATADLAGLRDAKKNPQAAAVFGKLTDAEVAAQVNELAGKKAAILAAAPPELKPRLEKRLASLQAWAKQHGPKPGAHTGPSLGGEVTVTPQIPKHQLNFEGGKIKTNGALPAESQDYLNHIDAPAASAIQHYTGSGYKPLNKALNKGKPLDASSQHVHEQLQAAFQHAKPFAKPVTVKRGIDLGAGEAAAFFEMFKRGQQSGHPVQYKGYMSTSTTSPFSGNIRLTVHATKGLDVKPLSGVNHEDELLLNSGSRFNVLKCEQSGSKYHIELEQVE